MGRHGPGVRALRWCRWLLDHLHRRGGGQVCKLGSEEREGEGSSGEQGRYLEESG